MNPEDEPPSSRTIPEPSAGVPHTLVQKFTLRVMAGPDDGSSHTSEGDRVVVGTHQSANLRLHDPTVSRLHCELVPTQAGLLLRDLQSLNGTFVDGVPVLTAYLRSGSVLTLGRTRAHLELGEEPARVPISRLRRFGLLIGASVEMRRAFAVLERAAETEVTVLLLGETGTGKEAAAESLHRESPRRNGPFIVVDCGAIPPNLLESELFGHVRGAFTGAVASREGAFEASNGGTLFLDEIGELPLDLQPKLLRALEAREIKRVGAKEYTHIDARIIAATHRDLAAEVNTQKFRSDLFYRLAVLEVRLPPLRERLEDLPELVEHMLKSLGASDKPEAALCRTPEFLADLRRHSWPGNVRELRNYVERCLALNQMQPRGAADEMPVVDVTQPIKIARDRWTRAFERRYLEEILERHGGNVAAAARAAGVDRIYFYRLLWRHGLR